MSVVKRWKITIWEGTTIKLNEFYIDDNHYSNVLRQLANMHFGPDVGYIEIIEWEKK